MAAKKLSGVYLSWPKPTFTDVVKTNKHYKSNLQGAMLYVHYELSSLELRKEVVKYLKQLDPKHPILDKIKDINENKFTTVGKYMYILNHGGEIPDNIELMPALDKIIKEHEDKLLREKKMEEREPKKDTPAPTPVVELSPATIQDRMRDKAREAISEIEGWVDDFCMAPQSAVKTTDDFLGVYATYGIKAAHTRFITPLFERRLAEITETLSGTDKYLIEAYSNYTKPELKKLSLFYSNILKSCDMLQNVAKLERAPRKQKPVPLEKLVANIKYLKQDPALGVVSLTPAQAVGAKVVWCFDTKKRKIMRFVANDTATKLSIKGSSLIDYNTVTSISKTLRKPVEQLAEFKKCSKVQLRTFMDTISGVDVPASGRFNENMLILRIEK